MPSSWEILLMLVISKRGWRSRDTKFIFFFPCFLRQVLTMRTHYVDQTSLERIEIHPLWLLSIRIKGVCHYTWSQSLLLKPFWYCRNVPLQRWLRDSVICNYESRNPSIEQRSPLQSNDVHKGGGGIFPSWLQNYKADIVRQGFCTKVVLPGSALEGLLQEASWWHCHYTSDRGNTNTGEIAVGGENRSTAYQSGRKRSLQINPADSRKKFTMLFN